MKKSIISIIIIICIILMATASLSEEAVQQEQVDETTSNPQVIEKTIKIWTDAGSKIMFNEKITIYSELIGYSENVNYQWQEKINEASEGEWKDVPNENARTYSYQASEVSEEQWIDIPNENASTYSFQANEVSLAREIRLVVTEK